MALGVQVQWEMSKQMSRIRDELNSWLGILLHISIYNVLISRYCVINGETVDGANVADSNFLALSLGMKLTPAQTINTLER